MTDTDPGTQHLHKNLQYYQRNVLELSLNVAYKMMIFFGTL